MTYKTNEIPEILTGQRILNQATDVFDKIEDFNAIYFADKPYSLVLTGNFDPSHPLYDIEIATDAEGGGYGFSIFGQQTKQALEGLIVFIEQALRQKTLFNFMLDNCFEPYQDLGKKNFITYIINEEAL